MMIQKILISPISSHWDTQYISRFQTINESIHYFNPYLRHLNLHQTQDSLKDRKCIHSLVSEKLCNLNLWNVDVNGLDPTLHSAIKVHLNQPRKYVNLREDKLFLAAISNDEKQKLSILYTLNSKEKVNAIEKIYKTR